MTKKTAVKKQKSIEKTLWDSANKLRSSFQSEIKGYLSGSTQPQISIKDLVKMIKAGV